MTSSWFERIEGDWQRVTSVFHHHGDTMPAEAPRSPSPAGAPMALADTSTDLANTHAALKASLETSASSLRDALDTHAARLESLIGDVAAVASIADHPLVVSAARLVTETAGVPAPIVDGFVAGLEAISRAFPKPEEAPAEPAPPAAEVPAEPQPEPAAA